MRPARPRRISPPPAYGGSPPARTADARGTGPPPGHGGTRRPDPAARRPAAWARRRPGATARTWWHPAGPTGGAPRPAHAAATAGNGNNGNGNGHNKK